ncbi:MAG: 23S rRNA pseudouridine1911/1915/1917 synthase [Planctomycetota bacterium]|jgi:23S rRNA pseudouridine1911/1915/1917 synthase
MPQNFLTFVIPQKFKGERLDRVLDELVPDRSRAWLQKLARRGGIRIQGNPVRRSNIRVQGGERLALEVDANTSKQAANSAAELEILFEDEHLIAINKPPGLLTHAAPQTDEAALADLLVERFGPLPTQRGAERPGIVHRLDRETSGVIVAARDSRTMDGLSDQFRAREVQKLYLALVHGTPAEPNFDIDLPLEPQRGAGDREQIAPLGKGKSAETQFRLEASFGQFSLLACMPRTGRRHQIRVHAAEAGFPVMFDKLYRRPDRAELPAGAPLLRRHALHASEIRLTHPITAENLHFKAPPPADFAALLDWLEQQRP